MSKETMAFYRPDSPLAEWSRQLELELETRGPKNLTLAAGLDFCLNSGLLKDLRIDLTRDERDLTSAMALKEEGNRFYKEGLYKEARDAYTRSLQSFPGSPGSGSSGAEYAIVLANRSAALDAGMVWDGVVRDIDLAFEYGYPKHLHFKIYYRKGHALLKLRQFSHSKEMFAKCLDTIGKSEMPSKQRDQFRNRCSRLRLIKPPRDQA